MGDPDIALVIFSQFRDPRIGGQDGEDKAIRGVDLQITVRPADPAAAQMVD